jgi:hypothetical protein
MKRILDYDCIAGDLFSTFYTEIDTRFSNHVGIYDIIVLSRDNIQDNFDDILPHIGQHTKVIVSIVAESGCIEDFLLIFYQITKKHSNIQFYLIADCELPDSFDENVKVCASFKISPLAFFENFSHSRHNQHYNINYPFVYKKENGFSCLNGRLRTHRILLLLEFLKRNLLHKDSSSVSFLFYANTEKIDYEQYDVMVNTLPYFSENDIKLLTDIKEYLPIKLNDENGDNPALKIDDGSSKKIISLITENVVGIDCGMTYADTITFTEKTWKPFKLHQVPIYIGIPGSVSTLRSLGFDLFDDIIDHSYDTETDPVKRIKLAVDQLEKVLELDLVQFYKDNHTRFVKNNIQCETIKMEGYIILKNFILENDLI